MQEFSQVYFIHSQKAFEYFLVILDTISWGGDIESITVVPKYIGDNNVAKQIFINKKCEA